jgi:hypothetical protein
MVDPQTLNISVNTQPLYITIIALLIPVVIGLAGWYFGHRTAMKQIEKTLIKRLQIESSRELIKSLRKFLSSLADLEVFLVNTESALGAHAKNPTNKESIRRLKNAFRTYLNLRKNIGITLVDCVLRYEDNEVILKDFKKFHREIFNGQNRLVNVGKLYENILTKITISYGAHINKEMVEQCKEHTKKFLDFVMEMTCYADDYIRELQNCYQSELFKYKIPPRKPSDKSKVLTLDK